jgi:PadR family transcriptional regulator, regulatory protein PadR
MGRNITAPASGRALLDIFIALDVADRSGGLFVLQHGTLYPILHRLEKLGLVRSVWAEGAGERRRRIDSLTASGNAHLAAERSRTADIFRRFLEAAGGRDGRLHAGT